MKRRVVCARLILVGLGAIACAAPEAVLPQQAAVDSNPVTAAAEDEAGPRVFGPVEFSAEEFELLQSMRLDDPIPANPTNRYADDPDAFEFGRRFFYDERFSASGQVGCVTCHDPMLGFADGKMLSDAEVLGRRHTPGLWNAAYQRWFFWDGRTDSLWAQALSPLENDLEHATTRLDVAHAIADDARWRADYEALFGALPALEDAARFPASGRPVSSDPEHPDHVVWTSLANDDQDAVTQVFVNVGKALEAFQRRIVSNNAPFDQFVAGALAGDVRQQRVFSAGARRGFKLFVGKGRCVLCHHGPLFSDFEFHNTRIPALEGGTSLDGGRFKGIDDLLASEFLGTSKWSDDPTGLADAKVSYLNRTGHNWGEFKTPSLRNVAVTAPYMHNGKFKTLDEVVFFYSTLKNAAAVHHGGERLLVPVSLSKGERRDLVGFLESLTDASVGPELLAPE